jgi:protein-S-isoprenylcysteine O-methyltransferase Ste14
MIKRILCFVYGVISYTMFFTLFLYLVGFLGNFVVPVSIDGDHTDSLLTAGLINLGLILLFGIQHTVMARPTFKKWVTQYVPKPIERATYVILANVVLILLFWQWRPMGGVIWDVQLPVAQIVLYGLFAGGWLLILSSTFMINHFDLFGLRQVWLYLINKPYKHLTFRTPGIYSYIRRPLYVGWMLTFWATPSMTVAHLVFALGMTAYILIAIPFEERNLVEFHDEYDAYRKRTPMFIPKLWGKKNTETQNKTVSVN